MKTYDISTATVNKYHSSLHNLTSLEIDYSASGFTASDNWTITSGQSTSSGSFETYADQYFFLYCLPGQVAINGQPVKITGIKALVDKVNQVMIDPRQECSAPATATESGQAAILLLIALKEQFTAHCAALCALVNSKYTTSRTRELYCKRLTAANLAIERMRRFYAANPTSAAAPAILSRANEMQAELDAALNRTTPATATESGQAAILLLVGLIAVVICLYLVTSGIARAAGYTDIAAMLDAMTHIFPTP